MSAAGADPCGFDLSPRPWATLPPVGGHPLPARFSEALRSHPLTQRGHEVYGQGEGLSFDFSDTNHDRGNGWGIQAHFLRQLLAAWFPRAEFADEPGEGRALVRVSIVDSRLASRVADQRIEMDALKTANPSFELPPRPALRARMALPASARIASFYASRIRTNDIPTVYLALLDLGLADIVIVSTQGHDALETIELSAEGDVPIVRASQWLDSPRPFAVILNDTRGRMPYVHAAADYAVVLGAANGVEPLHQGRPTYVSRDLQTKGPQVRWDEYVRDLTEVGGAHAFGTLAELKALIHRTSAVPPRSFLYEDDRILGRLLTQILAVVRDAERTL